MRGVFRDGIVDWDEARVVDLDASERALLHFIADNAGAAPEKLAAFMTGKGIAPKAAGRGSSLIRYKPEEHQYPAKSVLFRIFCPNYRCESAFKIAI